MNARAAKTQVAVAAAETDQAVDTEPVSARVERGERGRSRPRGQSRTVTLTRAQEYAFIRGDMQRLLVIAAVLLAVMAVLLLVVGR